MTLPRFDAAPPVTEWGIDEVAIDLFHHAVYVTAAAAAYELLEGARVKRLTRHTGGVFLWVCGFRAYVEGSGNESVYGSSAGASPAGCTARSILHERVTEPRRLHSRLVAW